MKDNWKKETIKGILLILLIFAIVTVTVLLTDNGIILIISGILIETIDQILNKWLDENWKEE